MTDQGPNKCQYGVNCPNEPVFRCQIVSLLSSGHTVDSNERLLCQEHIDAFGNSDRIKVISQERIG